MLETRSIGACAKLKPVEQVKSEISPVELVTGHIEEELQKVSPDVMVRVKDAPLCTAYGYVYPRKHFAGRRLVLHPVCLMPSDSFVRSECRMGLHGIRGGTGSYGILYPVFLRSFLQVRYGLHPDMTGPFPGAVLPCRCISGDGTLCHQKHCHGPAGNRQVTALYHCTVSERRVISWPQSMHVRDLRLGFQLRRRPPHSRQ